jgi:hypothetical protein
VEYLVAALTGRTWASLIGFTWFAALPVYVIGTCILLVRRFRTGKDDRTRRMPFTVLLIVALLPPYAGLRGLVPAIATSSFWPPWDYFALFALTGIPITLACVAAGHSPSAAAEARA